MTYDDAVANETLTDGLSEAASDSPASNSEPSGQPERQSHPTDLRRWADGTWRTGDGALVHGVSRYRVRGVLPEDARRHVDAFHAALVSDLGGEDAASTIEAGYARRLAQLEGTLELLSDDIAKRGVMTERGRPRATYTLFVRTLETWDRLAQRLPRERRTRQIASPLDFIAGKVERG